MDEVFTVLRVVVSLGVVVGVIWFVQKRFVRTIRTKSRTRPVSLVARLSVGRNSSVAVVAFRGKEFLLGVTEHGISVLDSIAELEQEEFAAVLTGVQAGVQAGQDDNPPVPGDRPLIGSILSPATWKQAFSAIKGQR